MIRAGLAVCFALVAGACGPDAVAREVRGEVSQGGEPVEVGGELDGGEDVVVGHGRAVIEMIDGVGTIRVYDESRLRLRGSSEVKLAVGRLWALITPGEDFEVHTDNAVAGVRGTSFVVDSDDDTTEVAVMEGEVEVHNPASPERKLTLRAEQNTRVQGAGAPSEPGQYNPLLDERRWRELGRRIEDALRDAGRKMEKGLKKLFR